MQEPKIFSTVEWKAQKIVRLFDANNPKGIVIHHTASPNRQARTGDQEKQEAFSLARAIQADHLDRNGWADTGQNFTVSRGGLLLEGRTTSLSNAKRGVVSRGAHAGTDEGNLFYFGIEVEGNNKDSFQVTESQWSALVELCAWLSVWGQFQSSNLQPHKDFAATECPGKMVAELPKLRTDVREKKIEILKSLGKL